MQQHRALYNNTIERFDCFTLRALFICALIFSLPVITDAQCPVNIDFESGTFNGWTCYVGSVAYVNGQNQITLSASGPIDGRHTMLSSNPGNGLDDFGHFPMNCPNGSGHSIKLGNDEGGAQAEGVSYEFTIPPDKDAYSIIYHYAVVFQDPDHLEGQQPRMEIEVTDVSNNEILYCSSFAFHPYGSVLPGFELSDNPRDNTPVWFKNWSAVSINLDNRAGRTIRMFFKTADCTFRKHFGYAYIDVNSECSGEFVGAAYCPDDTAVNVVAPYGYQSYKWFDNTFTNVLGTSQTLTLNHPPVSGTTIAVELTPYDGYGCLDTLYAKLLDTLTVQANTGPPMLSCNMQPVQLGGLPKAGLVYHWTPPDGLSNPDISNPLAAPPSSTLYTLHVSNSGGGCKTTGTVEVKESIVDTTLQVLGDLLYCSTSGDSTVFKVRPNYDIRWFKDGFAVVGATQPVFHARTSGTYYAQLTSDDGCSLATSSRTVFIETPKPGITYPVKYAVVNLPLSLQARQFGINATWQPAFELDNPVGYSPVFKGGADQTYTITITTAANCTTVDTQFVKTINGVKLIVPNAFTPNGDGNNDVLRPLLLGIKELRYFRVYNRWGQLMFESKGEQLGWDGNFKGVPQSTQTVVWEAEGIGVDNNMYKQRGTAVLLR